MLLLLLFLKNIFHFRIFCAVKSCLGVIAVFLRNSSCQFSVFPSSLNVRKVTNRKIVFINLFHFRIFCTVKSCLGVIVVFLRNSSRQFSVFPSSLNVRKVTNRKIRLHLAAAYKGLDSYGLNEGVCNHLSAVAPATAREKDIMLIIPHGLHWSEVTPSLLIGVDESNKVVEGYGHPETTALCIHRGVYAEHPEIKSIMHTHMPYATALTCLTDPQLLMIHQNSARFYKRIAYDLSYGGLGDNFEEGRRLGKVLGEKNLLLMGNHGVMSVAGSIAVAFDNMYYLERAAMFQILACSSQRALNELNAEVLELTSKQIWHDIESYAESHLKSVIRRLRKDAFDGFKECTDYD